MDAALGSGTYARSDVTTVAQFPLKVIVSLRSSWSVKESPCEPEHHASDDQQNEAAQPFATVITAKQPRATNHQTRSHDRDENADET